MNSALRTLRPRASRFQPSALPRLVPVAVPVPVARFSASARRSYEYIEVSEPRPGVGQGEHHEWRETEKETKENN